MKPEDFDSPATLFSLKGKVALVTGAAGHLGTAISSALSSAGARVYLNGRNVERLNHLQDTLNERGHDCRQLAFDITKEDDVDRSLATIEEEAGRLDVVVNNAYGGSTGTLETADHSDYASAFHVAVGAPAMMLKKATPLMEKSASATQTASVINVASMYGIVSPDPAIYGDSGHNSPPYYGAAKGALLQFTRYAAVHLAEKNIRVNAISPGAFPKHVVAEKMPELWQTLNAKQPMKRTGRPEELRGVVLFLASGASSYVTGVNIPVDGGWTAW